MELDLQKLLLNIRRADTEGLLDQFTAFRAGMEPDAIDVIEQEIHRRRVTEEQISRQREIYERECIFHTDGTAKMCSFCRKPAVREGWGWHRMLGNLPLFPRRMRYCKQHSAKKCQVRLPTPSSFQ